MLEETKLESSCGQLQTPLEFVAGMRQEKCDDIALVRGDSAVLLPGRSVVCPGGI